MKKILFGFAIVFVALIGVVGTIFVYNVSEPQAKAQTENKIPKAAIIDQLYSDIPNEDFHEKATEYLETAGYKVDIFKTPEITIDFYKKLPTMNYDFIIVRTHGAADKDLVTLFTGERYQEEKYITEQLFGQAKRVTPLYEVTFDTTTTTSEWTVVNDTYRTLTTPAKIETSSSNEYFAITPKLIDEGMQGKFENTIFILGGCNTMNSTSMAESLVKKGASEVVGWNKEVTTFQNDMVILSLLEQMFISKNDLSTAVDFVTEKYPPNQYNFHSTILYYS